MIESEEKMHYTIKIDKNALRFLDKLEDFKYNQLIKKIFNLESNPRPVGCVKLNTIDGYRIKWNDYRILFTIKDKEKEIVIYEIGDRKEVYKKK